MAGFEDYKWGKVLLGKCLNESYDCEGFGGVIQCAMRLADSDNLKKLKFAFPKEWDDLQKRYNAPGGKLEGE